jgi:murein endopeptidase
MLSLLATSTRALLVMNLASAPLSRMVTPASVPEALLSTLAHAPYASLDDAELASLIRRDIGSLGSMSVGRPNRGQLINGVQLKESEYIHVVRPETAYATEETLFFLQRAVMAVHRQHPDTRPLYVGDISQKNGGHLKHHRSHQSGRDVDVGFFYTTADTWYRPATAKNLDLPRTWTFLRSLLTEGDVEMIFIATYIQKMIRSYAASVGEDPRWLAALFDGTGAGPRGAVFRHAPGHATHFHIRFHNPFAERAGSLAYASLVRAQVIPEIPTFTLHKAKKGETLGMLAKKYGTTVLAIQRANGLKGTTIQAKRVYKIPTHGAAPARSSASSVKKQPARQKR